MHKRGPLNEIEEFFIKNNINELSVEELSEKMNRTVNQIQKFIDSQPQKENKTNSKKSETTMMQLTGRHARKGKKVATIMTPAASELADSVRPKGVDKLAKLKSSIHRPLDE